MYKYELMNMSWWKDWKQKSWTRLESYDIYFSVFLAAIAKFQSLFAKGYATTQIWNVLIFPNFLRS